MAAHPVIGGWPVRPEADRKFLMAAPATRPLLRRKMMPARERLLRMAKTRPQDQPVAFATFGTSVGLRVLKPVRAQVPAGECCPQRGQQAETANDGDQYERGRVGCRSRRRLFARPSYQMGQSGKPASKTGTDSSKLGQGEARPMPLEFCILTALTNPMVQADKRQHASHDAVDQNKLATHRERSCAVATGSSH
jgi:hypothetical protein